MSFKIKTFANIINETFSAPTSGSYVVPTKNGEIILRDGGSYEGVDLSGVNLSGKKLPKINLKGANLAGTIFIGSDLTGANLSNANISGAKFDGAILKDVIKNNVQIDTPPSGVDATFFTNH